MKKIFIIFGFLLSISNVAQTKVSGVVYDDTNATVPYANLCFKGTRECVTSDENGRFYLESESDRKILSISFVGFKTKEIILTKAVNYDMKISFSGANTLDEVKIFSGKTSKKNNPALDILRKIWERKRKNGLRQFNQYQMNKYEKVEFDMNTIDSAFMKNIVFKGMEFIFKQVDTSKITGKTYLPVFINESLSEVYGDNTNGKTKEVLKANKNSGLGTGNGVDTFIKDLYPQYDIYNNYLSFFDKNFVSPLSKTGINTYNYVLSDSAFVDKKWCYNIVFYPRRKNELTFKGDFWVNDTTFAIKKINLTASKSANVNWVKEIYIEQEFDVLNDSVFLLKRDYMMSDFALNKKESSKGVYGKRTTLYSDHKFNEVKSDKFYKEDVNNFDQSIFTKSDEFWQENRAESLNKDEAGIYKMLDTLKTVRKFKQMYTLAGILGTGYVLNGKIDYGPIFSFIGYNDVEGLRLRVGGRTYFSPNDKWRLQGYTAYGFKDDKVKYGFSGKWMVDPKSRLIISAGNRRDIEQIGVSLTTSNDIMGRSFASSSIFAGGDRSKLTNVNLTSIGAGFEPYKNLIFKAGLSYRTLASASSKFSLDFYKTLPSTLNPNGIKQSEVRQSEIEIGVDYMPGRKVVGYGVEQLQVDKNYPRIYINYNQGFKGILNSDFEYKKLQLYYRQPILIAGMGRLLTTFEVGKIFGGVPLGLIAVIPGNQSYFIIENTYSQLNYYELVTDQYASLHLEHDFNGRLFSRIPYLKKLNLREIIGIKSIYGSVSDQNIALNASGFKYQAPTNGYWEYHAGIGNIFKVFRLDFAWRGSYENLPEANKFSIKGSFGFYF
ncbi:carboxypeptidase-like regulatory domain-containing protein [Flavobacterium psychrophilum]|nr:carboxypeptidase-like regulatory domain-containing protein [Flavobacterium psychrophilum]